MVGGRVGRYFRVKVYTTFGHFVTEYIPIKSACIIAHDLHGALSPPPNLLV